MFYYKAIISYDGTNYHGWQSQPHKKTIQDTFIKYFKKTFGLDITITGASRTDAGVHALGQSIGIKTNLNLNAEKIKDVLNKSLPSDIKIESIQKTESMFNPRHNVSQKTYFYDFIIEKPSPVVSRYCWYVKKDLDLQKIKDALNLFVGKHDFRSFCTGDDHESTIKTIDSIELAMIDNRYRLIFKGQSFLRYMIRRIVGSLIVLGASKKILKKDLEKALREKNPKQNLLTAPPCGLTLVRINYEH